MAGSYTPNTPFTLTLTGTGFTDPATLVVDGTDETTPLTVTSDTSATISLTWTTDTDRQVAVKDAGGTSNALTVPVTPPTPTLTDADVSSS